MRLFTSESVTPGHPDKLCDQVSDAILDAYLERDPGARVAVEVMATAEGLVIAGEASSRVFLPPYERAEIARGVIRRIGYPTYARLPIQDRVVAQSGEIGRAVSASLELRDDADEDPLDGQGAGDQGMMFGYATRETDDLMPLPISLAHALARQLYTIAADDDFDVLGPDGKTQVTVAYDEAGVPDRVESILVSSQHAQRVPADSLRRIINAEIIAPVLERFDYAVPPSILINPSGSFVVGGPAADAGLTGRKIIVDTYGGAARHGGGAFSGKDPSKVDRSAAYAMRWVAKHVVAAGLARRCEVQVAYAIGSAHPVGLYVETFGTGPAALIEAAIRQVFDLRPAAIIRDLDLLRPIYSSTSAYGHFGSRSFGERLERPWEQLSASRVAALQLAVGGAPVEHYPADGLDLQVREAVQHAAPYLGGLTVRGT